MKKTELEKKEQYLKCHRCEHFWDYRGKNIYVATCPHCKTTLTIPKHKIPQANLGGAILDKPAVANRNTRGSDPVYG